MAFVELTEKSERIGDKKVMLNTAHIVKVDPESGKPNAILLAMVNGEEITVAGDYDTVWKEIAKALS